jgi:hypothetical protein
LPVDNVVDIEESNYPDFADTIKIRVIDNDETFAVDEVSSLTFFIYLSILADSRLVLFLFLRFW